MKTKLTFSTLILLLAYSVAVAIPQQPVSPEKKSAMHKLDPVDIFPQLQERNKDRNRKSSTTNADSTNLASAHTEKETHSKSRRHSRRHSTEESLPADLVATASPTPASTLPEPTPSPDSQTALGETASNNTPLPPQTMAAINNIPPDRNIHRNSLLPLPIILALLVLVLLALIFAFTRLIRYLRDTTAQPNSN